MMQLRIEVSQYSGLFFGEIKKKMENRKKQAQEINLLLKLNSILIKNKELCGESCFVI